MDAAIAGAMLLALPVMELLSESGTPHVVYAAAGIVAAALLVAAAAVFVRSEG